MSCKKDFEIYHIETMGTLDGPGVRTVIFFQGCIMKCGYCHNPDSWELNSSRSQSMSCWDLYKFIIRYKDYYGKDGGVTFSGGEPLVQSEPLLELITLLKEDGIHIALDTSGCIFNENTIKILEKVDLVLLDIKAINEKEYMTLTNNSMRNPLLTLKYLKKNQIKYWIRHVVIEGFNNSQAYQDAVDKMTASPYRERLEFLKYHTLGEHKWSLDQKKYKDSYKKLMHKDVDISK
ncbi:MAG: radical SAM protein [Clostridia bacterium]|nr:radical SAM protein [Clostridia bacterium]